jgi:nitrite reductase/ring-hydroxylating ferredoxin subunit
MSDPTPATPVRVLADARALGELRGARFTVTLDGVARDAFAVRWRGVVRAYVNACPHQRRALDFGDAQFFDESADALVCTHHGARFRPDDGACFEGPCAGSGLTALAVEERDGALWCLGRAPR